MKMNDPMHPLNPISPFNPASPLHSGHAFDGTSLPMLIGQLIHLYVMIIIQLFLVGVLTGRMLPVKLVAAPVWIPIYCLIWLRRKQCEVSR